MKNIILPCVYFPLFKLSFFPYVVVGIYSIIPNNFPISTTNLGKAKVSLPNTILTAFYTVSLYTKVSCYSGLKFVMGYELNSSHA